MDRVGYDYIYQILEEEACFNGYRPTPHESVRAIPFELAAGKISLMNAEIT